MRHSVADIHTHIDINKSVFINHITHALGKKYVADTDSLCMVRGCILHSA